MCRETPKMPTLKLVKKGALGPTLLIDDVPHYSEPDEAFEVRASSIRDVALHSIPRGVRIRPCDKVIGSRELVGRSPFCTFERTSDNRTLVHVEAPFLPDREDLGETEVEEHLSPALQHAATELQMLTDAGIVISSDRVISDEMAEVWFTVRLDSNQTFAEAEDYIEHLQARLYSVGESPARSLLFVCHASEDKPFVSKLVTELDRRAQYAWFDQREILVGDSIVERINQALGEARFIIAVLSPSSVRKPWVLRELNSSLMRQLAGQGILILPILIAPCEIPPLLADIKYADFSKSFSGGFAELLSAIRGPSRPSGTG